MTYVDVALIKGAKSDDVEIRRSNGTVARFAFPKKGPIPHDAVHIFVEQTLGLNRGFWGMVASGLAPEAIQDIAKTAGHASAKRAQTPDPSIVELLQAERLVECFEADLWSGPQDGESFRDVARAACEASFVPLPPLDDEMIQRIREKISEFANAWMAASVGARIDLRFEP